MKDLTNDAVIHVKKENIEYLQFRRLLQYENNIKHAYTLFTHDNDFKIRDQKVDRTSYHRLANALEIPWEHLVKPDQHHTDHVQIITQNQIEDMKIKQEKPTDGLITDQKELALMTTNADCILMLFYDPINHVIANVHSGWRGTIKQIGIKTVQKMQTEMKSDPKDIICCICPSIRVCHFEVKKDVKKLFEDTFSNVIPMNDIIRQKDEESFFIDTVKLNILLLEQLGLKQENIIDSHICSVCQHDQIHSYRMEKEGYGLSAALIEMI